MPCPGEWLRGLLYSVFTDCFQRKPDVMRRVIATFVICAFVSVWFAPLSTGSVNSHICEVTNTLCKNTESCPLKRGHEHKKDAHEDCYLTVYNGADSGKHTTGHEGYLQFTAGWPADSVVHPVSRFEPQTSLIVKEVSHTPPHRPPQTG